MKLIAFILAFYTLFLSFVSCCTTDECMDSSTVAQQDKGALPDADCDNCSPFTMCGSCTGFIPEVTVPIVTPPEKVYPLQKAVFLLAYIPQYYASFWNPPRV